MTLTETVEDCVKWYWQGFDAFSKMDAPVCPYINEKAKTQWWCGYNDAEMVHNGVDDYKEYNHDYNREYSVDPD